MGVISFIRKIGNSGQITLPKKIMEMHGWQNGTSVEIFFSTVEMDRIILKKYQPGKNLFGKDCSAGSIFAEIDKESEAIKRIKSKLREFGISAKYGGSVRMSENETDGVIGLLSELEQYRAIGTVEQLEDMKQNYAEALSDCSGRVHEKGRTYNEQYY